MKYKRIITIVLDSVGIGAAPDSEEFGDIKVNTIGHISESVGLEVPNLEKLGLGNIESLKTVSQEEYPKACYTKMTPKAKGKDTLAGHWEMMGVTLEKGFKVYIENGFDDKLIKKFEDLTGRKVLANKAANGMKVIDEYYDEHIKSGSYIVYTSVDSTFQIAAHEEVIPLEELYKACEIARDLTKDPEVNVARVIARPFVGAKESVVRTANRKDYAISPPQKTIMDKLVISGHNVIGVGKISDIFNGQGISKSIKSKSNMDGVDKTLEVLKKEQEGFIFVNLVDFDSMYGHTRDVTGYKDALEMFDARIPEILEEVKEDDLLIITADHGNDPTYKGNDHTREYVPLLIYNKNIEGKAINVRNTFEDLGQTLSENFGIEETNNGKSFLEEIL